MYEKQRETVRNNAVSSENPTKRKNKHSLKKSAKIICIFLDFVAKNVECSQKQIIIYVILIKQVFR